MTFHCAFYDELMSLGNSRASNSIKGLFNTWDGEPSLLYNLPKVRAESNGELTPAQGLSDEEGKQMILGPISLGGQKKGDLFQIEVESFWKWEWNSNNANKFTIRNFFKAPRTKTTG